MSEETEVSFRQAKAHDQFLIIRKNKKYSSTDRFPKVSIRREVYDRLAEVANESCLSMSELTSQAIRFALDRLSWVEE